jgi:hypothetical protein
LRNVAAPTTTGRGGVGCSPDAATTRPVVENDSTRLFGLSALEDQQLGGLVMWLPTGFVYFAAGLVLVARCGTLAASREAGRPDGSTDPLMDSSLNRRLSSATNK